MFEYFNPNPIDTHVRDCAVRAVAKALDISWEEAYIKICYNGYLMGDMASSNIVWGAVLRENGFTRKQLPNDCPDCYTIRQFLNEHPTGTYVFVTDNHAVTAIDGTVYDIWDSSGEVPIFVWQK